MDYKKILWISHSAITSYEKCPHLYYLDYEYRNPETGNRIQIINPYLSLGLAVHETIEELKSVAINKRTKVSLKDRFTQIFEEYRGLKGGFLSKKKEEDFFKRGLEMVRRVEESNFLSFPSITTKTSFPTVNLIGEEVKLVGNIDWIEHLPSKGAHIIDFKTGNKKESNGSLQLPIYTLLAEENLEEKVEKVSYWYLQHDDAPVEQEMKDTKKALELITEKAKDIKKAIDENFFPCNYGKKCFACRDYEKIFSGDAELISKGKKDTFCIFKEEDIIDKILNEDFLDERQKKIFEMRVNFSMEEINKNLRLDAEKSNKIVSEIKDKLKKNLHPKELKVVVKILKNDKK
jgi:hypothetical protein